MSKKEVRKTLRFSADEYELIEQKISEHKLTFSEFARSAILRNQIKSKLTVDLVHQISRVGNNLNQIAKSLNKKQDISNIEIMRKLIEIKNKINEFTDDR